MAEFDLVIRNGTVVTGGDLFTADVGISGGRISAFAECGKLGSGFREMEAFGKLILPGGVDSHCHLDQPTGDASEMADDFLSGTVSAACGGTTTVIPFACQQKGRPVREAVSEYHRRAEGKAAVDFAFHLIVTDLTREVLDRELPALIRDGYTSFKIYMTYEPLKLDDRSVLDALCLARREGAIAMIHAENSDAISWLTERLESAGLISPHYHAVSRPAAAEREAIHRIISFAEIVDVPVLIVHVSGAEGVEQIRWAQAKGLRIYAETCPQYLFLTAENLKGEGFDGAKYIFSPPPRGDADRWAVWNGLATGVFQVFSSDHAPFRFNDPNGKMVGGADASFTKIPNGIPGIETRLPLLFSNGVGTGKIGLTRFVELTAANPARMYGLYPRKGTIAVGSDADIAIWDPAREVTITNSMLHHNMDYTPYEGMTVRGWPET
ncbi:MAG TPA: dihydropyrimidinase, partial [Desulfobacteraceae bacterium]|nr:dihydropyrimidinase [Desulfobacteraceae bacterium]